MEIDMQDPNERLKYLIRGLIAFGLNERQILGVLNILSTDQLRQQMIDWMMVCPETETPSDLILKAVDLEQAQYQ